MLDMRTVILGHLATDVVCTLVMVCLWRQNRARFAGTGWWAGDFACQSGAVLLVALRGTIPLGISAIVSNTLVVAGALAGYRGLELFVGTPSRQRGNFLYLAAFPLIHGYFLYVTPSLAARNINLTLGLALIGGQCVWLLLRRAPADLRPLARNVALVFVALTLINLVRALVTLATLPQDNDFFRAGTFDALCVMSYQVLLILLAYSLALMVNRRLLAGLHAQEEKFSKAFHSSPYAITITRLADGRMLDVNRGFVTLSGYAREEVIGRTSLDLQLWERDTDRNAVVAELAHGGPVREREFNFRCKSGEVGTGLFSAEIIVIDGQPCILSSIADITARKAAENDKSRLIDELHATLDKVKRLEGMLPICMYCKKIRDDGDQWQRIEDYIRTRSEADFSHGICPDCFEREHGDLARRRGLDPVQLAHGNGHGNGAK